MAEGAGAGTLPVERVGRVRAWLFSHPDGSLVALLILAYLIIQVPLLRTPHLFDPTVQFLNADDLFGSDATWHSMRIGLTIPMAGAIGVFGFSEAGFYAVPVAAGAGLIAATYCLGKLWFGRVVAVAAAAGLVLSPYILDWSSQPFPDVLATATFVAAAAFAVLAGQRHRAGDTGRIVPMALAASGLFAGWSYLVREFMVLFFPVLALVVILYGIPWRRWWWIVGAAGLAFGAELAWGWMVHGDPLSRLQVLFNRSFEIEGSAGENKLIRRSETRAAQGTLHGAASVFFRLMFDRQIGILVIGLIAAAGVAAAVVRSRPFLVVATWFTVPYVGYVLLGWYETPEGGSIIRLLNIRYWFPLLPAITVGGFGALSVLSERSAPGLKRRWPRLRVPSPSAVVALCGSVLVTVGLILALAHPEVARSPQAYRDLRSFLADEGEVWDTIAVDTRSALIIRAFTAGPFGGDRWQGDVVRYDRARFLNRPDRLGDSLLVLNLEAPLERGSDTRHLLPARPPEEWVAVFLATDEGMVGWATAPVGEEIVTAGTPKEAGGFTLAPGARAIWEVAGESDVPAGAVVAVRVEVAAAGEGSLAVSCAHDGQRSDAVSAYQGGSEVGLTEFVCRAAGSASGRLDVTLIAVGPLQGYIGTVTAAVAQ